MPAASIGRGVVPAGLDCSARARELATHRARGVGDKLESGEAALDVPPAFALKVAHHGSRSSSTPRLLALAAPRVAIVSVGDHSRFGHPHPEVVDRYRQAGVALFRTDRDGAVTFSTDGRRVWMATYADEWTARIR